MSSRANALQPGDRAPDYSGVDSSTAADRRTMKENSIPAETEENAAPQREAPVNMQWKVGQDAPNSFLSAPYPVSYMNGDGTAEDPDVCHEVDIYAYGEAWDPKAPTRVRDVTSKWTMDTDFDGSPN